ncbi:Pentalenolactone D synthase [Diplogelasinospora grovesii]|uniref:Pentalenolactone D synthase n=1 Tax=Diplogelasinospora grovesii TaxID=303347 RepID=A0AAN6S2R8_9PEZI|nr:Pentalenolactone D synthase [Diplogelasinospora grovesii]
MGSQPEADGLPSEEDLKLYGLQQKYTEEAAKRFRPDGIDQFVELKDAELERFRTLGEDPWADHAALNAKQTVKDGARYKFLVLGAGYGGLLFAVHLIEAGVASGPDDIRIVDTAGGFGGTWYWNRYPGLHCDVESYTYMPLLEETGYMPKSKYAPGHELREHADRIATKWGLHDKAVFRASVKKTAWNESAKLWDVEIEQGRGPGQEPADLRVQTQYVLIASGVLSSPQVPKIPGLETFAGPLFHTARWDYSVSGGKPEDLSLTGLQGKRVGFLGTGATAIQAVPHLARWAKEVYVFQRTPSSVTWRGQRPTDPQEWETKIASKKGWQMERMLNFNAYLTNSPRQGEENMVGDGWTEIPAYCALLGCPDWDIVEPTPEKIGAHVARLYKLDVAATEAKRARVDQIVKDAETAGKMKAWYPTWCKRPTFSDEYLQTFNLPHVHLVDTDGKGVSSATERGLVVAGKEYPLDILILGTGYRTPAVGNGSPARRTGIQVYGRGGNSLDDKWQNHGAATLHGVCSNGFPNLFFMGSTQTASAANFVLALEVHTRHVAHMIAEAERKVAGRNDGSRAVVEVTSEAEEAWTVEIMRRAAWFASVMGCTPGYITSEGQRTQVPQDPMEMMKASRAGAWSQGMENFIGLLEEWKKDGSLKGLEITPVAAS